MHYRNRLSPITLSCKYPLSKMVVYFLSCNSHFNQFFCNGFFCFFHSKSAKLLRVHQLAALAQIILLFKGVLAYITTINNLNSRYIMRLRILKIPLVVTWNSHNRTCTIACKHKVTYVYRNFLAVCRIYRIYAFKYTA